MNAMIVAFCIMVTICWLSTLIFASWVIKSRRRLTAQSGQEQRQLPTQDQSAVTAEEILRQRFVTGEITTEEYEQLLEVLLRHPLSPSQHVRLPETPLYPRLRERTNRERRVIEVYRSGVFVQSIIFGAAALVLGWMAVLVAQTVDVFGSFEAYPRLSLVLIIGSSLALSRAVVCLGKKT